MRQNPCDHLQQTQEEARHFLTKSLNKTYRAFWPSKKARLPKRTASVILDGEDGIRPEEQRQTWACALVSPRLSNTVPGAWLTQC